MSNETNTFRNSFLKFKDMISILDRCKKNRIIFISILILIGLGIRLFIFPYDVPLFNDAQGYFWYAIEINILNNLPYTNIIQYENGERGHTITNNGWPIFLSLVFKLIDSENFLDYHNMQRMTSLLFSVVTVIPVYLLCSKFFKKSISLLASSLFILEPRLIQNSVLGTPESLYIFLLSSSLVLFLSNNMKMIYASFVVIALFSIVRYEGILMIVPFSVIFFIRFRKQKKDMAKYLICISVFALILIPVAYIKSETMGYDGFTSHISAGPEYYQTSIENNSSSLTDFFYSGSYNLFKYLGWAQLPIFIMFIPVGIFYLFKKIDYKKTLVILTIFTMLIPAFYAYSREFSDTKYIYILYPVFCIIAGYSINFFFEKSRRKNLIFCLIIIGVIFSSVLFVEWKNVDQGHYRETFGILKEISQNPIKVNGDFGTYGGEFTLFHWVNVANSPEFPTLKKDLPVSNVQVVKQITFANKKLESGVASTEDIRTEEYYVQTHTIKDYMQILEKQNITHLLLDKNNNVRLTSDELRLVLRDIFQNESKYPFLTKEYDSNEHGYDYQVKLFKIDFDMYKEIENLD